MYFIKFPLRPKYSASVDRANHALANLQLIAGMKQQIKESENVQEDQMTGGVVNSVKNSQVVGSVGNTIAAEIQEPTALTYQLINVTQAYLEQLKTLRSDEVQLQISHVQGLEARLRKCETGWTTVEYRCNNAAERYDQSRKVLLSDAELLRYEVKKLKRWNRLGFLLWLGLMGFVGAQAYWFYFGL